MNQAVRVFGMTLMTSMLIWQCSTKSQDNFCTPGGGKTILTGRILDSQTNKPIDSVEISIGYGPSWDHLIDTLVKQNDSVFFVFNAPDDCEPYFFLLSNKHYWYEAGHPIDYNATVNKGGINTFNFSLKPATVFQFSISRDTLNMETDTVFLEVKKGYGGKVIWDEKFSAEQFSWNLLNGIPGGYPYSDSGSIRMLSADAGFESNEFYHIRWVYKNGEVLDTTEYQFVAKPFDTVNLRYAFRKK